MTASVSCREAAQEEQWTKQKGAYVLTSQADELAGLLVATTHLQRFEFYSSFRQSRTWPVFQLTTTVCCHDCSPAFSSFGVL